MRTIGFSILSAIFIPIMLVIWTKVYEKDSRPLVLTKSGWVRGLKSPNGGYEMFLGVPYAKIREDNPFGIADPYPSYEGILDANDDNNSCPQYEEGFKFYAGTLDCLRLHIYTPRKPEKLAVMVYIHGGKFRFGHSGSCNDEKDYDPVYLMRHDIVFVSITFRLGAYGVFCLGTRDVPGNTGFKDQLMALRWIKNNIEAFGGDPDRVTLFGHSSGSVSVDLHVHYEHDDLFHQAILQSGAATGLPSLSKFNISLPLKISENLGFKTRDLDAAMRFLSKQEPLNIVKVIQELSVPLAALSACIEKEFHGVEHFITKHVSHMIPKVKNRKFLIGNANGESNLFLGNYPDDFFDNSNFVQGCLNYFFEFNEKEMEEALYKLRKYYLAGDEFSRQYKRQIIEIISDLIYIYANKRRIDIYHKHGADKIYYYMFTYIGGRNMYSQRNNLSLNVAVHADELGYLFQDLHVKSSRPEDHLMIDRMTTLWTNFAKYGDPTPAQSDLLPRRWEPISEDNKAYFRIDSTTEMDTELLKNHLFWDKFYKEYSRNLRD